jgi:hypothetical protein
VLKRGLAVTAGAVTFGGVTRTADAAIGLPSGARSLVLEATDVRSLVPRPFNEAVRLGDRITISGDLVDASGTKLGEFYALSLVTLVPNRIDPSLVSSVENHTFQLADGSILGAGTTLPGAAENAFAVVGGTGRFAGARGTYVSRVSPYDLGGDGTASFAFTLMTEAGNADGI